MRYDKCLLSLTAVLALALASGCTPSNEPKGETNVRAGQVESPGNTDVNATTSGGTGPDASDDFENTSSSNNMAVPGSTTGTGDKDVPNEQDSKNKK